MKIFVFGLYEEDSGKTLLALQLIRALKEVGTSIVPFKPMSGHNLWRQYENLEKNVKMKKLFSYDLDRLRNASGTSYPHEILNPVCILTSPYNVKLYIENDASPKSYLKESLYRNFMLGRITQCSNESVSNLYLVNEQRIPFLLHHEDIINSLLENADETKAISSEDEFLKYYQSELVENAIQEIKEKGPENYSAVTNLLIDMVRGNRKEERERIINIKFYKEGYEERLDEEEVRGIITRERPWQLDSEYTMNGTFAMQF